MGAILMNQSGGVSTKTIPPQGLNLTLKGGNGKIDCTFTGIVSEWLYLGQYYRLIAKPGGAPTSPTDGVAVDVVVGSVGSATISASITGLINGVQYYVRLYVRGENGWQTSVDAVGTATPQAFVVYGVRIDETNPNPESAVAYTDDCAGFTPSMGNNGNFQTGSWNDATDPIFSRIRPCLFKDGAVVGYLNPNNFAQFENGTAADITSGNAGDVMIEIPRTAYAMYKEGNYQYVKITDDPNAPSSDAKWCFNAHTRSIQGDRDYLYVGAYEGYVLSNKLRSLSGKVPTTGKDLTEIQPYANNMGNGYDPLSFYPLTLIQAMYLIRYKNLCCSAALGLGTTDSSKTINTGSNDTRGMNYGNSINTEKIKLMGLEGIWGNIMLWIAGLMVRQTRLYTAFTNFNDTGAGYTQISSVAATRGGYLSKAIGNNSHGFIIEEGNGSSDIYYCCYSSLYWSGSYRYFARMGGYGSNVSLFGLSTNYAEDNNSNRPGGRLMYL